MSDEDLPDIDIPDFGAEDYEVPSALGRPTKTLANGEYARGVHKEAARNKSSRQKREEDDPEKARKQIELAQRKEQALKLRMAGATYEQIAKAVGWANRSVARKMVEKAIQDLEVEPAKEVVLLELQRLDAMTQVAWKELLGGDTSQIGQLLRIMDMRARYMGLDAWVNKQAETHITVAPGSNAAVAVQSNGGVMVIRGTTESEYVRSIAEALGKTPEEIEALRPGKHEDKPIIKAAAERAEEEIDPDDIAEGVIITDDEGE